MLPDLVVLCDVRCVGQGALVCDVLDLLDGLQYEEQQDYAQSEVPVEVCCPVGMQRVCLMCTRRLLPAMECCSECIALNVSVDLLFVVNFIE